MEIGDDHPYTLQLAHVYKSKITNVARTFRLQSTNAIRTALINSSKRWNNNANNDNNAIFIINMQA